MSEIFEGESEDLSDDAYIQSQGMLEEDYKLSTAFLDATIAIDTIHFKKLINKKVSKLVKNDSLNENSLPASGRIQPHF